MGLCDDVAILLIAPDDSVQLVTLKIPCYHLALNNAVCYAPEILR